MSQQGLPTPAPSTEIQAKIGKLSGALDSGFSLPPAAITPPATRNSSTVELLNSLPEQASKPRSGSCSKTKSSSIDQHQEYALPPPPTRSRKIIQMKPRDVSDKTSGGRKSQPTLAPASTSTVQSQKSSSVSSASSSISTLVQVVPASNPKRKASSSVPAGSGNSAATRKMARKTAHSLIERRRRSKMNEEFGVLKDMIPACTGQEMHKLAILQASIEYMRYLEKCLTDLQDVHAECAHVKSQNSSGSSTPANKRQDIELPPISTFVGRLPGGLASVSPVAPLGSTASPEHRPVKLSWTAPTGSGLPSPIFKQQPSPGVSPKQMPEDHEVTTALLMLNSERRSFSSYDRRDNNISINKRAFSVRELLTED